MTVSFSQRRLLLQGALTTAGAALASVVSGAQPQPRTIELVAKRFEYVPKEVPLKVGERVIIAIKSLDFVHGMNIPDLNKRLDLVPGRITQLELQPTAPGVIEFVCDNFCGDKHEEMHGSFVVSA